MKKIIAGILTLAALAALTPTAEAFLFFRRPRVNVQVNNFGGVPVNNGFRGVNVNVNRGLYGGGVNVNVNRGVYGGYVAPVNNFGAFGAGYSGVGSCGGAQFAVDQFGNVVRIR